MEQITEASILAVIEKHLIRCVGDISEGELEPDKKLTDYGANSLDIVDIVSGTMRELRIKIPRNELADIENVQGLVDTFIRYKKEKAV